MSWHIPLAPLFATGLKRGWVVVFDNQKKQNQKSAELIVTYTGIRVPQSSVLGHVLAAGLVPWSQLDVVQVTAPGVPDLPASTPHFVVHPVGSACIHLPEDWMGSTNQANKLKTTAGTHHYRHCGINMGEMLNIM